MEQVPLVIISDLTWVLLKHILQQNGYIELHQVLKVNGNGKDLTMKQLG
mgnify:CR=1 FL=1